MKAFEQARKHRDVIRVGLACLGGLHDKRLHSDIPRQLLVEVEDHRLQHITIRLQRLPSVAFGRLLISEVRNFNEDLMGV